MEAIRIGVIGYGYWGPNMARNFVEIPASQVVAIADVKDEQLMRAASRYPNVTLTKDYHDFFNIGMDAVVVATPPKTHFQIAEECLFHNFHVLIEKPMTLNSQDAEKLVKLADDRDRILMVGHTFVYNSAVHAMKKYIQNGDLGDLYYLDAARLNLGLFQRDSNVLWDLAPHDISIMLFLLDKYPTSVSAYGMPCVTDGIFDVAFLRMEFPDKIVANIHVSWLDPCKVRRVTVVGSKKMAVCNDLESEQKIRLYDKGVEAPPYTNGFGEFQYNYRSGDIIIPKIHFTEPLRQECQHFLDSIINHTEPNSSGRDGLRVVKILERAQHSLNNGSSIEVLQW